MQVYLNLWGGEGFLTCASLLAMASVGMFNDIKDTAGERMELHYRCLDFTALSPDDMRWKKMSDAYQKYFKMIFGSDDVGSIIRDKIDIFQFVNFPDPPTLNGKYDDKAHLSLGCSEQDMILNIHNGIYGKPWVGEAYHADSAFEQLYRNATGNIIIINCGGYKGGGTAATFIPLETNSNVEQNSELSITGADRFNVIAGPSTEFYHMTKIPNFGIYNNRIPGLKEEIDLFDIPQVIEKLESYSSGNVDATQHRNNIQTLEAEYAKVVSKEGTYDYSNLNPKYYMARFIDRIRSDTSFKKIKACFIHINPKREGVPYRYDCTSKAFQPDNQNHMLHITNMLNAVAIQEIAVNHAKDLYTGGKICTFCGANDKYTAQAVFLPDDARRLYRFIAFSIMMTKYVYSYFDDITRNGADIMMTKWALQVKQGGFLGLGAKAVTSVNPETPEGQLNHRFSHAIKLEIAKLAYEYIQPVLQAFVDVNDTSDDVEFFSATPVNGNNTDSMATIVDQIIKSIYFDEEEKIHPIENATVIKEQTEKTLTVLLTIKSTFDAAAGVVSGTDGNAFLTKYQKDFPVFGFKKDGVWNWEENVKTAVEENAQKYFESIVRYTYQKIEEILF